MTTETVTIASENPPVTPQDFRVRDLEATVQRLKDDLDACRTLYERTLDLYKNDMAHWEKTMRQVKEDKGWCDEGTNEVIEVLNNGFKSWKLDPYEQEFSVDVTITAEVHLRSTISVMATSLDAAREMVDNDPSSYMDVDCALHDEIAAYGFDKVEVEVD